MLLCTYTCEGAGGVRKCCADVRVCVCVRWCCANVLVRVCCVCTVVMADPGECPGKEVCVMCVCVCDDDELPRFQTHARNAACALHKQRRSFVRILLFGNSARIQEGGRRQIEIF